MSLNSKAVKYAASYKGGANMQRSLIAGNVLSNTTNRNIGVSRLLHSKGLFWVTSGTCRRHP